MEISKRVVMTKKSLATIIYLGIIFGSIQGAFASGMQKSESIEFKEGDTTRYAIINFTENECKIFGAAARRAQLYSCFAIVLPGGKVSSITYMLTSADAKLKDDISCRLSDSKTQATLFHTRFSDNLPRKGLGAFATYAQARNTTEDGSIYYGDIAFPAWWLNQNKHVDAGLIDVRADDICGISYYFKPSRKLINLISTF